MLFIPLSEFNDVAAQICGLPESASHEQIQQEISELKIEQNKCQKILTSLLKEKMRCKSILHSLNIKTAFDKLPVDSCLDCLFRAFLCLQYFFVDTTYNRTLREYYENRYRIAEARFEAIDEQDSIVSLKTDILEWVISCGQARRR